jgi:hypothetical protein
MKKIKLEKSWVKKRRKKTNRQKLLKELYDLWCEIIHLKGKCEICGKSNCKLDAHHIEGRTGNLKWSLDNGILLCFNCHRRGVHHEASSIQAEFREKITKIKGQVIMDMLKRMRYENVKHNNQYLEEMAIMYNHIKNSIV